MTRALTLIFLLLLCASGCGEAEDSREELIGNYRPAPAQVNIPDPNFRRAVEQALGKPQDAPITDEEMATLTELDTSGRDIRDLTGLEFAAGLTTLDLSSNQIADITPLAGLTQLTRLSFDSNRNVHFADITPLAGLTQLQQLDLDHNQISDITPLAGLTRLTKLDLDDNQITDITPLAGLTQLASLHLSYNPIEDTSSLCALLKTNLGLELNIIEEVECQD